MTLTKLQQLAKDNTVYITCEGEGERLTMNDCHKIMDYYNRTGIYPIDMTDNDFEKIKKLTDPGFESSHYEHI